MAIVTEKSPFVHTQYTGFADWKNGAASGKMEEKRYHYF